MLNCDLYQLFYDTNRCRGSAVSKTQQKRTFHPQDYLRTKMTHPLCNLKLLSFLLRIIVIFISV